MKEETYEQFRERMAVAHDELAEWCTRFAKIAASLPGAEEEFLDRAAMMRQTAAAIRRGEYAT